MDMKHILQALDNASTKPVEGANAMSKFLRIVSEADLNQAALPAAPKFYITQTTYDTPGAGEDFAVTDLQRGVVVKSFGSEQEARAFVAQQDPAGAAQTELHQVQSKATAPEANPDAVPQPNVISEGANPHKVSLPVQMAMQHYQQESNTKKAPKKLINKYFEEVQEELIQEKQQRRELINQYASIIAERVRLKESGEAGWGRVGMAGVGMQPIDEMPISATDDPNNPLIHGHQKANPMTLQGRIKEARNQLRELSQMAESNDLAVWQQICKLAKGGMFMGLEQNIEQIQHGINELAAKRKKGGTSSRGIDKNI